MPYKKVRNDSRCPKSKPVAVVKEADNRLMGCHKNEADANRQIAALNAAERRKKGNSMRFGIQQQGDRWLVVNELGETLADCATLAEAIVDLRKRMAAAPAPSDGRTLGRVRAMLAPEGVDTSDNRHINEGALTWRDMPLPLMNQTTTEIGHFGAELAGRFDSVERRGNEIWATGDIDESEAGQELLNILQQHGRYGISIDMGAMDGDIICEDDEDCRLVVTAGEIMGATGTPFPAFAQAFIELDSPVAPPAEADGEEQAAATVTAIGTWSHQNGNPFSFVNTSMGGAPATTERCEECEDEGLDPALVAAAIPVHPPADWFDDPGFDRVTPLAVHADGRVAGHLAPWGECHVGRPGVCVTAPRSSPGYPYFRTGVVLTASGDEVPVGQITLGTGHASASLPFRAAAEHYDSTGTVIADVACGEDDHGIWVAGALRPGTSEEEIRQLRAASLSGDWRTVGGRYELVAALAVNVPGFPIPRTHAGMIDGRQVSLVAAGVIPHLEPWELAHLEIQQRLDEVASLVASIDARTRPLSLVASAELSKRVRRGVVPSSD